jgi:serine protein kinase
VAANPVHLMYVLEQQIEREQFPPETEKYPPSSRSTGAALRRVHRQGDPDRLPGELQRVRAEHLRPLRHLRRLLDPGPGVPRHRHRRGVRPRANAELEKIEKPAGIAKDFRNEIVNFVLRARQQRARTRAGPATRSCAVIEKKMFSNTEELLPVISFNAKASADEAKKHEDFVTAW